jgi:hypothetical protein
MKEHIFIISKYNKLCKFLSSNIVADNWRGNIEVYAQESGD